MHQLFLYPLAISLAFNSNNSMSVFSKKSNNPKIQAAIILDVSNSMDGLIEQAKEQLWNMVTVFDNLRCDGTKPEFEIALYEYGRDENSESEGYIKMISPFTRDLDRLYIQLNQLTTHGGSEFCGQVLCKSLDNLNWDNASSAYKVIFIAGNESFLQGNISYQQACNQAKNKGVIINTIYCGFKNRGIEENWNLGAECGGGIYSSIDQDARPIQINTPYDSSLMMMNEKLYTTYLPFNKEGLEKMDQWDTVASYDVKDINKIMNYVVVRSNRSLYNDIKWDLISAYESDSTIINKLDLNKLPDSLRKKSRNELYDLTVKLTAQRNLIRNEVLDLQNKRSRFIDDERKKFNKDEPKTLTKEIESIILKQSEQYNLRKMN